MNGRTRSRRATARARVKVTRDARAPGRHKPRRATRAGGRRSRRGDDPAEHAERDRHGAGRRRAGRRRSRGHSPVGLRVCAPVAATFPLTHPDKVLFPDDGITKADLAAYYRDAAPRMVDARARPPGVAAALQRRHRQAGFFQKNVERGAPPWVKRVQVGKRGGSLWHVLANDAATLVWLANQNCITPHVWLSRADRLERPDRMIFDLDPASDGRLRARAPHRARARRHPARGRRRAVRDDDGLEGHPRRRRAAAPLRASIAVRDAAVAVAAELVARRPKDLTTEFYKRKRDGRLFVDVNRNAYAATAVPPYGGAPAARRAGGHAAALGRALRPAPARPALDDPHRARARSRRVGGPAAARRARLPRL